MPDLWNSGAVVLFGLFAIARPQDGFWTKPEDEERIASAQTHLSWFRLSGGYRKLDDPQLNLLVRQQAQFVKAAAVIAVLGIAFVLLRP